MGKDTRGPKLFRWASLALAAVVGTMVVVVATPAVAWAETTLDVQVGYGGEARMGTEAPVVVTIEADSLIDGQLELTGFVNGQPDTVQRAAVQVAGGTTKQLVFVMPATGQFGRVDARLIEGDIEIATGRGTVRDPGSNELVGVLPELGQDLASGRIDDRVRGLDGTGQIRLAELPVAWLDRPGAIEGLDFVALTSAEYRALGDDTEQMLANWAWGGGIVAIVGSDALDLSGGDLDAIGQTLYPLEGRQVYGLGGYQLIVDADEWPTKLQASRREVNFNGPGDEMFMNGFFGPPMPLSASLSEDAGVRLPSLPWLTGLLAAYLVVAGPIAWIVFRARKRTTALWVAIPAIALVFTGAVWVAGSSLRSGTDTAHATTIEVTAAGADVRTAQLLTSRRGGSESIAIPDGWRPATAGSASSMFFFGPFGSGDSGRSPIAEDLFGEPRLSTTLDAGGFAIARLAGPEDRFARAVVIDAQSDDDGAVLGTVTNNLAVDLHNVGLIADRAGKNLGTIEAGQTVEFVLRGGERDPFRGEPIEIRVWPELRQGGWFEGPFPARQADEDGGAEPQAFNGALWSEYSFADPLNRPIGQVLAAGFTRDLASPIDATVTEGRTMVLARAEIEPTERITNLTVLAEPLDVSGFGGFGPEPTFDSTWRFTLPLDRDYGDYPAGERPPLVLSLPNQLVSVEVWSGTEWLELDTSAEPIRPNVELPDSVVHGREVLVRIEISMRNGPPSTGGRAFTVREPEANEDTIPFVVAVEDSSGSAEADQDDS